MAMGAIDGDDVDFGLDQGFDAIQGVSANADRLVGEVGTMKADLTDSDEVGQAKVLGGVWSVKTDNPPLKKGDKVKVLSIDGVKLIVEKAE